MRRPLNYSKAQASKAKEHLPPLREVTAACVGKSRDGLISMQVLASGRALARLRASAHEYVNMTSFANTILFDLTAKKEACNKLVCYPSQKFEKFIEQNQIQMTTNLQSGEAPMSRQFSRSVLELRQENC